MKKALIAAFCFYILVFCVYYFHKPVPPAQDSTDQFSKLTIQQPPANPTPEPQLAFRTLDVDAMAARMKKHQDLYKQLRDKSLQVYAANHPGGGKSEKTDTMQIRLAAYLWVWDDFYEEGLWQTYENNSKAMEHTQNSKNQDLLVKSVESISYFKGHYPLKDSSIQAEAFNTSMLASSDYPAAFKMSSLLNIVHMLCDSGTHPELKTTMAASFAKLPSMVRETASWYRELIKDGVPDDILIVKGIDCLDMAEDNADAETLMASELDKAFEDAAPASPARTILQGRFYIDYAWTARGSGWAKDVSQENFRLFNERLDKASEILEAAYEKYPDYVSISRGMIKVELGQGQGKDRMEMWFARGLKADPDNYGLYYAKSNYLLPRWYGSQQEQWDYARSCVETQNWSAKIPMIMVEVADYAGEDSHDIFAQPEIWDPLEKVFREWLSRYPESTIMRSKFIKYAAMGQHWAVVKEQCAILGDNWDRDVFYSVNYPMVVQMADENTKKK